MYFNGVSCQASLFCCRLSRSRDDAYVKGTRKYERVILERGPVAVSFWLIFVFAFSLRAFRGPDFLGAWNKLRRL